MSNETLAICFLALLTGMTIGAYIAKRHEDDLVIMIVGILQIFVVVGNKISEQEGTTPVFIVLLIIMMIIIGALSNYNLVVENYRFKTQQRRRKDDDRNRPNKTLRNVCGSCKNDMPR